MRQAHNPIIAEPAEARQLALRLLGYRYLLFHKPFQVLCQFTEGTAERREIGHRRTLADFIPIENVYPAGRLDFDSEGLLLLTDDGVLQHHVTDPRFGHPRTYWVQVEGTPAPAALLQLETGVTIQGYRTQPAQVRAIVEPDLPPRDPPIRYRKNIPVSWIEITLREGRNRQVRRMTAAVGLPALRLVRVAMGRLRIDGLAPGAWRDLRATEVRSLKR
ncbi:MAG TPA: pseudouridine synthase [Bryobacteraceae bacterium]|nr:pseudouridine synthase [Bryobacteraceae bacterium]